VIKIWWTVHLHQIPGRFHIWIRDTGRASGWLWDNPGEWQP